MYTHCLSVHVSSSLFDPVTSWFLSLQLDVVQNERTELVKQCAEQKLVLQQRETALEGSVRHRATEETAYRRLVFKNN